jgi:glycosyltransferase involved in cell wall biosynthesis
MDNMPEKRPLISVIIPHLNQPEGLAACLRSLDAQSFERSAFEVIVVDNGSTVFPDAVVRQYRETRLLRELRPGPGLARNRGIQAANADVFAFIDADCRAHPDWLRNAFRALHSVPLQTVLGGDVQIWRESNHAITAIEAYESVFAYRFQLYIERHGFSGTGNLIVRRSDYDKIGPFGGIEIAEDIDWGQRARAAGFSFRYVSDVIVFHPARRSLQELFVKWDRHIQHAVNKRDQSLMWRVRWFSRAFAVLLSPYIEWVKIVRSDRLAGMLPRFKAILVLVAVRSYRAYTMISLSFFKREVVWNRAAAVAKVSLDNDIA